MWIDDLLERNGEFVQGRAARPLPRVEAVPLAVVACYDPRLDSLLRPALGLAEGDGFMLRTAGAALLKRQVTGASHDLAAKTFSDLFGPLLGRKKP